jgi:ribosomal protein S18 acetylase RimI-like enzyme
MPVDTQHGRNSHGSKPVGPGVATGTGPAHVNSDEISVSMAEIWEVMSPAFAGSRVLRNDGVAAFSSGLPLAGLNKVWLEQASPRAEAVTALLDELAATGQPYSLKLRADSGAYLTELAIKRGMTLDHDEPAMAIHEVPAVRHPAGLSIRQLAPDELLKHVRVATAAFGVPQEKYLPMFPMELMSLGSTRCYAGELNGRPVSTGVGFSARGHTAVFSIATLPEFQGRRFGSAITARVVADGLANGSSYCWLTSSEAGYPVYRNLGFQVIETLRTWVSPGATDAEP